MEYPVLVSIQLDFKTQEDPEQTAERVKEAVAMVVGRDRLEEFRWRWLPLEPASPA
jgi:hypothetical protein